MKKIDHFTNQYPINKTLRFRLIPVGRTEEYIDTREILHKDEVRATEYANVKVLIDRYHKHFIQQALSTFKFTDLDEYIVYYNNGDRNQLDKTAEKMRKELAKFFKDQDGFTDLFKKEIITTHLPAFLTDEAELKTVRQFARFSTYLTGFHENRKNMYTGDGKATEIAYRLVDQNLPKYLDNCTTADTALSALAVSDVQNFFEEMDATPNIDVYQLTNPHYFSHVITQTAIDAYNQAIGGFTREDGTKVQGLNELINLYNQKMNTRLAKLKPLYKQILSDRTTVSFIPDSFKKDQEVLDSILACYTAIDSDTGRSLETAIAELTAIFMNLESYDTSGIFVVKGAAITALSNLVYGNWSVYQTGFENLYEQSTPCGRRVSREKYEEKRNAAIKAAPSRSIHELQTAGDAANVEGVVSTLCAAISEKLVALFHSIHDSYSSVSALLTSVYPDDKKLISDSASIALIKDFLDSVKAFQQFCKPFLGSGKELQKDQSFYYEFCTRYDQLDTISRLYDKVRNYLTQKPYSTEKLRLMFDNPQFLNGWSTTKEVDYSAMLFRDNGNYYLGVIPSEVHSFYNSYEWIPAEADEATIEKISYYQIADPAKDVQNLMYIDGQIEMKKGRKDKNGVNEILENLKLAYLPAEINRIRLSKSYSLASENFSRDDLNSFIEFYAGCVRDRYPMFEFHFRQPSEYRDFSAFTDHINAQAYQLHFTRVSRQSVDDLINSGSLYLFQIYNKDFSPNSHGTPNMHTLYFRQLFAEENLQNLVFALNGGSEMYVRKASVKLQETAVHPAGVPIKNKNPLNPKTESTFEYDLIKNRRYTRRQFSLHLPITLNFCAPKRTDINSGVRDMIRSTEDSYVIGIDRGERNLIYVCVVDGQGKLVEQLSLNTIISGDDTHQQVTDYHALLDSREKNRLRARKDWQSIEGIKELKEGYISQVVHKICELVEKYDAVIAMEDLNSGFKNSRACVEKSVYQKFEKMLIDKLNFYADKKKLPCEVGGIARAYQLTNKFTSFQKLGTQNGFIFYIPAWNTSKIDPTTGFVNLLRTRYESIPAAIDFLTRFDRIAYNHDCGYYEFYLDYSRFPRGTTDYQRFWTLTTQGTRIHTFRNSNKNNEWDSVELDLTTSFNEFFEENSIDINADNLIPQLVSHSDAAFYKRMMHLIGLMVQMRNSVTGTDIDYMISPVMNNSGSFYFSRDYAGTDAPLPIDADANGAYHIARKVQLALQRIKAAAPDQYQKTSLAISNKDWLAYIQGGCL